LGLYYYSNYFPEQKLIVAYTYTDIQIKNSDKVKNAGL